MSVDNLYTRSYFLSFVALLLSIVSQFLSHSIFPQLLLDSYQVENANHAKT